MKKILIIIICISVLIVAIGSSPPTYTRVKLAIQNVEIASNQILLDVSSICFSFIVIADFVKGYDRFETEYFIAKDANGLWTGEAGFTYKALEFDPISGWDVMNEEVFILFREGEAWENGTADSALQVINAYLEAIAPVKSLLTFDASEEEEWGFFEKIFNSIKWTVISIWSVISAVIYTAIDTVNIAWQIVRSSFIVLGLIAPSIENMETPGI